MCGQRLIFSLIWACPHQHPQGPCLSSVMKETSHHAALGFEVLLKSLRFSPCGPLSAAPNKRGFVGSTVGALRSLLDRSRSAGCQAGTILPGKNPFFFFFFFRYVQAHAYRDACSLRRRLIYFRQSTDVNNSSSRGKTAAEECV